MMNKHFSCAIEQGSRGISKVILDRTECRNVDGQDHVVEEDQEHQGQLHIDRLEKLAAQLRRKQLIKQDAPLINENWYGNVIGKYRLTFITGKSSSLSARLTELNRYILDDRLPSGQQPSGLKAIFTETSILREQALRKTFILEVCLSARLIVHNQYFEDGNHRTAVLMMYEMFADFDLVLECSPMSLYSLLSNRKEQTEDDNIKALYMLVWKHHHKRSEPVSTEDRAKTGIAVKDIQYMNTQVENIYTVLRQESLLDGRLKLRSLKRTDRALYNCLVQLKDMQFWS